MLKTITTLFLLHLIIHNSLFAQNNDIFKVEGVRFDMPQNGLIGYVDLRLQPACGGEPRIKVAVDKIVIEGFNYDGDQYAKQYDYQFPIEVTSGNIYLNGSLRFTLPGTNTPINYPIEKTNISIGLQGFLDWIVMSDEQFKGMICTDWKNYFKDNFVGAGFLKIVDEDCLKRNKNEICLFNKLVASHKKVGSADEQLKKYQETYRSYSLSATELSQWEQLSKNVNGYQWPDGWDNEDKVENLKYLVKKAHEEAKEQAKQKATSSSEPTDKEDDQEEESADSDNGSASNANYDDSDEAVAARVSANINKNYQDYKNAEAKGDYNTAYQKYKKYNSYKSIPNRDLNKEEMLFWGATIQNTLRAQQRQRENERAAEAKRWEELLDYSERRQVELTEMYKSESKMIRASDALINSVMNGYVLSSSDDSELDKLIEDNKYGPKKTSPYHIYSIYKKYENAPENTLPEYIYLTNVLFEYERKDFYKRLKWHNDHFYIPSTDITFWDDRMRKEKYSFYNVYFGTSDVVRISFADFMEFMKANYNFDANSFEYGKYAKDRPSNIFQELNNKDQNDFHLIAATNREEIDQLMAIMTDITPSQTRDKDVAEPLTDIEKLTSNNKTKNSRDRDLTRLGPELVDSRDGQKYKTVYIGDQLWMAENIAYRFNKQLGFQPYSTVYTASSASKVCPPGWKVPSIQDVETLLGTVINTFEYSQQEIEDQEYVSELFNNFGFRFQNRRDEYMKFYDYRKDRKRILKIKKWFLKNWVAEKVVETKDGKTVGSLNAGSYNFIPDKLLGLRSQWKTFKSHYTEDNVLVFWLSDIEFDGKEPDSLYGIQFITGDSEEVRRFTFSYNNRLLPCRCIQE